MRIGVPRTRNSAPSAGRPPAPPGRRARACPCGRPATRRRAAPGRPPRATQPERDRVKTLATAASTATPASRRRHSGSTSASAAQSSSAMIRYRLKMLGSSKSELTRKPWPSAFSCRIVARSKNTNRVGVLDDADDRQSHAEPDDGQQQAAEVGHRARVAEHQVVDDGERQVEGEQLDQRGGEAAVGGGEVEAGPRGREAGHGDEGGQREAQVVATGSGRRRQPVAQHHLGNEHGQDDQVEGHQQVVPSRPARGSASAPGPPARPTWGSARRAR